MKHFILVAGFDHEFKGNSFLQISQNRMKRLIRDNWAKEDLTFQIFDFKGGAVTTHELRFPGGKKVTRTTTATPFKGVGRANYIEVKLSNGESNFKFKDGQRGTMSILDIYKAVQKIAVDAPKSLAELSFFSHAGMTGPILVNSYEDDLATVITSSSRTPTTYALPSGARDPDDMDPRAEDFGRMNGEELKNFQNAFNPDGFIWIWGCAHPKTIHQLLTKIEQHTSYRDKGLADGVKFKFRNLDPVLAGHIEDWAFGGRRFADRRNFEITFKDLRYMFYELTRATYTSYIARNARIKTYGAVLGTFADIERGGAGVMRVSVHAALKRHFDFYQNYLGFGFDPEGRRYGLYLPDFTFGP